MSRLSLQGIQEGLGLGSEDRSGCGGSAQVAGDLPPSSSGGPAPAWCVGMGSACTRSGCGGYLAGRGVCVHMLWGLSDHWEQAWVGGSEMEGAP